MTDDLALTITQSVVSGGTEQDSLVEGGQATAGEVGGGMPVSGVVTGAVAVTGEVSDAVPQLSVVAIDQAHVGAFRELHEQQSGVSDGVELLPEVSGGVGQLSEASGWVVASGEVSDAVPVTGVLSGGVGQSPLVAGGLAQGSLLSGGLPVGGAVVRRGVPQDSVVMDFVPPGFPFFSHLMDTQCKILVAQEDPGHPTSNTWALAGTDPINTEKRTASAVVPWPLARQPAILVWTVRGFYLNTNAATTSFGFALYKDLDVTPFYQFSPVGLPFNAASGNGSFCVQIAQYIGGHIAGAFNQTPTAMGFFNAGPLVALGGAGHGATVPVFDVSRNTAAIAWDAREVKLTLATKKLTAQANVTLRTDTVFCVAYPSSGFVEDAG